MINKLLNVYAASLSAIATLMGMKKEELKKRENGYSGTDIPGKLPYSKSPTMGTLGWSIPNVSKTHMLLKFNGKAHRCLRYKETRIRLLLEKDNQRETMDVFMALM